MEESLVKSEIVRIVQDLPDDATVEDAMERLYFLAKIERGLEESEGETIAHEEIKSRFLKCDRNSVDTSGNRRPSSHLRLHRAGFTALRTNQIVLSHRLSNRRSRQDSHHLSLLALASTY